MQRLIDADDIISFPYSEDAGTEEQIMDWIEECDLSDEEDKAKMLCWKVIEGFRNVVKTAPTIPAPQWISVEDGMPPEHDSIFKKHKGTSKWLAGMYETISDDVNVVLRFEDGTEKVYTSHTTDGVWRKLPIIGRPTVTHWMPLPEPPEKRYKCRYADDNGVCSKCSANQ